MELTYQVLKERYIDLKSSHKTLHDEILRLQQENKQLKNNRDKAIEIIENSYYSKNTTDIDSIVVFNNKLLQVRNILKR